MLSLQNENEDFEYNTESISRQRVGGVVYNICTRTAEFCGFGGTASRFVYDS